jgi:uncharacterized protein with FMN-binding domain
MNRTRFLLLTVFTVSMLAGYGLRKDTAVDESLYLEELAPGIVFSEKGGSPPHYPSRAGVTAFNTYDVTPSIRGYAGPIRLLVSLSPDGRISGIKLLQHKETQNYVHRMDKPEFLGQFIDRSVNDPIELDIDIDGITRATVSVKALTASVRESSRKVATHAMGIQVSGQKAEAGFNPDWVVYLALFSVSFGMYIASQRPGYSRRLQRARDATLMSSLIIMGIWLSSPFSILHVLNAAMGRISTDMLLSVILLSVFVSIALAGRFYCGWLCPFGALSEFISRLPFSKWDIPQEKDKHGRRLKYALLGLVTAVVLTTGKAEFGNFETYVTLFSFHGTYITWAIVVLVLAASLRIRRFWCRYLCPVAAFAGLFSRKDSSYTSSADCPMSNRRDPLISECIRCNRCRGIKA